MTLDTGDLNEIDVALLEILQEGRITPRLAQKLIVEKGIRKSLTSQYVGQRLKRLEEHGYTENLLNTGVYELNEDPRSDSK
ncbi:hypothetical protein SAMN04487950_0418 [Halogranum rubrum]|uniref:Winged helix-turn-helix DNA-binding n=1 Tax=Halogranum rubrum TaxID=553466 RepID=A0A1I4BBW9_9EURY|nr:hypothetical protein [Halogranum rubrum]SFK65549.1 hypothetical protein SAMN04487950_0418 [Halogranum rubrum]